MNDPRKSEPLINPLDGLDDFTKRAVELVTDSLMSLPELAREGYTDLNVGGKKLVELNRPKNIKDELEYMRGAAKAVVDSLQIKIWLKQKPEQSTAAQAKTRRRRGQPENKAG